MLPVAILAGGKGTRMRPLTEYLPKSLLEIRGRPFIEYQLNLLVSQGIERVVICAGHQGIMLQQVVSAICPSGLDVEFSFDGPTQLGTAGALQNALLLLDDTFFVLYGDAYVLCDFSSVHYAFGKLGKPCLMTVAPGGRHKSNVDIAFNEVIDYNKKERLPHLRYFDYGLSILSSGVFEGNPVGKQFDLSDLYQQLVHDRQFAALEVIDPVYEVGSFKGLDEFQAYIGELHSRISS